MAVSTLILPLLATVAAGLLAGFSAGLFGIGGGFVVVPALLAVLPLLGGEPGHLAHVAVGTSLATIVLTSLRSTQAHARRGAVDFDVLRSWAPWVVGGVVLGVVLASRLSSDTLVIVFGIGVLLMSAHFLLPLFRGLHVSDVMPGGAARAGIAGSLGAFSSLLGIGGGTIAVIVMTLCGRTIHHAVATAAGLGVIIAIPGTIGFIVIGLGEEGLPFGSLGYVNIPAAIAIVSTSVLTAPMGVAAAHRLPAEALRMVFGLYLILMGAYMIYRGAA